MAGAAPLLRIACAGCRRSGSTWLYNSVRLAQLLTGRSVHAVFSNRYDPSNYSDVHIIKCHEYRENIAGIVNKVMISKRDFRDIAASAVRFGLIPQSWPAIRDFLDNEAEAFDRWSHLATIVVPYEDIVRNPEDCLKSICEASDLLSPPTPEEIKTYMPEPGSVYDPITKLWPNHITDGGIGTYGLTLSHEIVRRIESRYQCHCESSSGQLP